MFVRSFVFLSFAYLNVVIPVNSLIQVSYNCPIDVIFAATLYMSMFV